MIQLTHKFNEDRSHLILTIDDEDRDELLEIKHDDKNYFGSIENEHEVCDYLVSNSELQWIDPSETGDLTDAPMLGIKDENDIVIERWAFMNYQIESFLQDLLDKGEATFQNY